MSLLRGGNNEMDIAIRDTVEADLPDIFRIRTDPLVRPYQYKLTSVDTIDVWKQLLLGSRTQGGVVFKCATIVRQAEIIGHISQIHYEASGHKMCACGWNLAPKYWGQGIAVITLSELFHSLFGDQQIDAVISDCFANNHRCVRVIEKLKYEPIGISWYERLRIAISNRCLHWILRFQLSAKSWQNRMEIPNSIGNQ
jgi:RimJ/RimL family protein N-acetyltransferase